MLKFKYRLLWVCVLLTIVTLMTGCKDKDNMNSDGEAIGGGSGSYPVVCVSDQEYMFNYMQAYDIQMDVKSVYECLTPVNSETPIRFKVLNDRENLERVEYTLYDKSGKLIENGTVSDKNMSVTGTFDINLNNLSGEETRLELKLCFTDSPDIYYYTRVVAGSDYYDALQYVMDIENACLGKESPVDLTLCMEWDLLTNKPSYYESDINSSYEQVTWAGLDIGGLTSGHYINIVDYSADIISFSVSYGIYSNDEIPETYNVTDFLRVRELDNEMFLLNFYRNTYEYFCESEDSFSDSSIYLGVGSGEEDYISFENDTEIYFVQNQTLYYYDTESNEVICIYSPKEVLGDKALATNKSSIRLLDKRDNYFYFIVGGYLCDNIHGGSCGLSIMRYDIDKKQYEEMYFQPAKYNYQLIIDELDMLSYMSDDGSVFFISNGEIKSYNVESNTLKEEIKNISLEYFVSSPDGERIGWSKKRDGGEDILAIRNLNTQEELTIYPDEGTKITPIGFVKEDFVYGVSNLLENNMGVADEKQVLMHNICIVNENGEEVKKYLQEGTTRVLGGNTSDTVIVLELGEKAEQGTIYNVSTQQQIVSGSKTSDSELTKKEIKHSEKGNIWAISFEKNLEAVPVFANAEAVNGNVEKISVEPTELSTYYKDKYFLYAKGRLYGIYKVMREALAEASELAGVVETFDNDKLYYRVAKAKTASVLPQEITLAAELLSEENGVVSAWSKKVSDVNVLDITGFAMEDMLLFVSKGFPVLARYDSSSFVWVIGYTEDSIRCQKSDSQEIFEISKEEAEVRFSKTGYEYYTCND